MHVLSMKLTENNESISFYWSFFSFTKICFYNGTFSFIQPNSCHPQLPLFLINLGLDENKEFTIPLYLYKLTWAFSVWPLLLLQSPTALRGKPFTIAFLCRKWNWKPRTYTVQKTMPHLVGSPLLFDDNKLSWNRFGSSQRFVQLDHSFVEII